MEEWKEYKLIDVCKVINGRAYKQEELLEEGKYRVLRVGNIFQGNNWYYSDIELPEDKYCYNGDLLYAWSCGFAPYIWKGEKTIYHYHIWKLKECKEVVDRKFLYYYLIVNTKRFLGGTHGSVMLHLTKREMEEQLLRLPSLSTQQHIASILNSLDDKIEVNRRINKNLEQQAQALFKSWFVDFEPFKNGEFVESELGMIPKGWRVAKFGDFLKVSTEKAPVDSFPEYSVTNNGIIPRDKKFNKKLSMSSSKNKVLRKDNLVFGMSREILNWGVMEDEVGGVSSAYNVYILNKEIISPTYLKLYMKARISDFNSLIGTAAREGQSLDKGQLIQMQIYIPSESTLQRFFNVYYPLTDKIQAVEYESRRLAELRDTLLPKLMSGELKVNEIA